MRISLFGQLTDVASANSIEIATVHSTEELVAEINRRYPAMAGMNYAIAIDKKIAGQGVSIHDGAEIALLPPFSGG